MEILLDRFHAGLLRRVACVKKNKITQKVECLILTNVYTSFTYTHICILCTFCTLRCRSCTFESRISAYIFALKVMRRASLFDSIRLEFCLWGFRRFFFFFFLSFIFDGERIDEEFAWVRRSMLMNVDF